MRAARQASLHGKESEASDERERGAIRIAATDKTAARLSAGLPIEYVKQDTNLRDR